MELSKDERRLLDELLATSKRARDSASAMIEREYWAGYVDGLSEIKNVSGAIRLGEGIKTH